MPGAMDLKQKLNILAENLHEFLTEQREKHKDMNTQINSSDTLVGLQLWRLLEKKGIREAGQMADDLERLSVSIGGTGRDQIVDALASVPRTKSNVRMGGVPPEERETEEEE